MAADYRKFKTPFYDIEIGDPAWKRKVKLPHHILRLVSKVEIVENIMVDEFQSPSQMTLTFIEGSREPASPDYKLGTSGLYQIPTEGDNVDMDIAGSLTNRSGVITDLRFSGSSGITFLTEEEKKTGKVDNKIQKNVEGKDTTRKYKTEPSAPLFLFQQRNKIKVTWGYLESPELNRSIMLSIMAIQTDFPESGMPTTVVTCSSTTDMANQIAAKNGKPFGTREIINNNGDSILVFNDLETDTLIRDICKKSGMAVIISKNLPNSKADKDKQKMWIAGQSFHEFMLKLAKQSGAYYEILPDPKTGVDTILFIKKQDFEKRTILTDKELLQWKGPGSILRSVNVGADFAGLMGNAQKGMDENGEPQSDDKMVSERLLTQYQSSETNRDPGLVDVDPVNSNNPNPAMKGLHENVLGGQSAAVVENSPKKSKANLEDSSDVGADARARLVQISFTTVGYPKLMPGIMEITGIGVRYSGKYKIISVTHSLDSSAGYTSSCSGNSQFLSAGGVKIPDAQKGKEEDPLVEERLLKDGSDEPQIQYKSFKGG